MHPWESWAENWAHYMHIVDTLETAFFYGLSIKPKGNEHTIVKSAQLNKNAYDCKDFDRIFNRVDLSFIYEEQHQPKNESEGFISFSDQFKCEGKTTVYPQWDQ